MSQSHRKPPARASSIETYQCSLDTAAAREAVDAAVAGAVEAHVAWWRARTRKRRLVVERAEADGVARAKVLRILDELGQA